MRRLLLGVGVFAAFLGFERPGRAAPDAGAEPASIVAPDAGASLADSLTGEIKRAYDEGMLLLAAEEFERAYTRFGVAYTQSRDPRLLWNMALAQKSMRHYTQAQALLQRYLKNAPTMSDDERVKVVTLIKTFDLLTGKLQVSVLQNGARIAVDGIDVGASPLPTPLTVDLGTHELTIHREGFEDFRTAFDVDANETKRADVSLSPADDPYHGCSKTLLSWVPAGHIVVKPRENTRVFIDDVEAGIGHTDCVVPAGKHRVSVANKMTNTYVATANVDVPQSGTTVVEGRTMLSVMAEESREQRAARRQDQPYSSSDSNPEEVQPTGHGCGCRVSGAGEGTGPVVGGLGAVLGGLVLLARRRRRRY